MERRIKFTGVAYKWFDKVNGNTYHSVRITKCKTGETVAAPFQYGYGDHYKQTALETMHAHKWIPARYGKRRANGSTDLYMYERENNYPILWTVHEGLKRDCVANGVI